MDATKGLKRSHHKVRVSLEMKYDIFAWLEFLESYSGVAVISEVYWTDDEALELYTDSAGCVDRGFGIYFQGQCGYCLWPESWGVLLKHITFLELFPVVVALTIWGAHLSNKKVLFPIDNEAVVYILNTNTSKCPMVMKLVRRLVLLALKINICIKAKHIEGKCNSIADAISRCQWEKFRTLAPGASRLPVHLPHQIWQI